jgi:uncharacterized membrane protein
MGLHRLGLDITTWYFSLSIWNYEISWFAGLLYLPRTFVNHAMALIS